MSQSLPRLGVIIVNYNTRELLRRCIESVYRSAAVSADRLTVDVLVVDSASSDESAAMVASEFPQTALIASSINLGYTGGNNQGLEFLAFIWATHSALP
ncbi:MAG: glycosyltransferase [Caldilineaceae bacterium]